ncbi:MULTISPECIES: DMT family transporter [unclassified Chryseobacterium]|uniref:DMT family transporter n=1 Tax=unclassified Chryseobacterium TaxID=2593645 RepID=UPI00226A478A|nr:MULTISPECIES: DMT family transporter [unclassified Chryseobacterium]
MNTKTKGYISAIISSVSYGLIPLFILPLKTIGFSMNITLFYRFFLSALFILPLLIYKKESLKISGKETFVLFILGIFFALMSEFLFLGYDYLTPGIASTIFFVYPVIVALIVFFVFKEAITKLTVLSLFITVFGVFILSIKDSVFDINILGLCIATLSAVFYALYIVTVNKVKIEGSSLKITFYSMLFSSFYYLIKALLMGDSLIIPDVKIFFNLSLFALITTVLSILTLVYAIKLIGSTPSSIMGALEPIVAVVVSVLFFSEDFTLNLALGVGLITFGVVLSIVSEKRKSKNEKVVDL